MRAMRSIRAGAAPRPWMSEGKKKRSIEERGLEMQDTEQRRETHDHVSPTMGNVCECSSDSVSDNLTESDGDNVTKKEGKGQGQQAVCVRKAFSDEKGTHIVTHRPRIIVGESSPMYRGTMQAASYSNDQSIMHQPSLSFLLDQRVDCRTKRKAEAHSNSHTNDEPPSDHRPDGVGNGLSDSASNEDDVGDGEDPLPADDVRTDSRGESSKQRAERRSGGDELLQNAST
jgi:hypothetical protein